jgi:hypothetical protein
MREDGDAVNQVEARVRVGERRQFPIHLEIDGRQMHTAPGDGFGVDVGSTEADVGELFRKRRYYAAATASEFQRLLHGFQAPPGGLHRAY